MNLIISVSHCGSYAAVYEASFITTTAMHLDIPTRYLRNTLGANVLSSTIGKKKQVFNLLNTFWDIHDQTFGILYVSAVYWWYIHVVGSR